MIDKDKTHKRRKERMPNLGFKLMSITFKIHDILFPPNFNKRMSTFNIKKGYTVIDYGCGPGRYLNYVSDVVGENGIVYSVDIHELAIKAVKAKIKKHNLKNVIPVLANRYSCDLNDNISDLIYVLDTFHMIEEPTSFLKELHRLLKKDGTLIIDDGHQPRNKTKEKILQSKVWKIVDESKDHLKCIPVEE